MALQTARLVGGLIYCFGFNSSCQEPGCTTIIPLYDDGHCRAFAPAALQPQNTQFVRVTNLAGAGMIPSKLGTLDMMTPDDVRMVSEIIAAMLKEGRGVEVDEIIVQIKIWEQDYRALGPDLARIMLEVDRMRREERATHHRS